jgi:putative oxidoreductase
MNVLARCYRGWIQVLRYIQPVFLLAMRVLVGWGLILAGWGKLTNIAATAAAFAKLGIPQPELNAWLAGLSETVGGGCLILGLASRLTTIPLIVTMIVAYATAHKEIFPDAVADPSGFVKEFLGPAAPPTPYLIGILVVFLFGPGLLSVDGLLKRLVFDRRAPQAAPGRPV